MTYDDYMIDIKGHSFFSDADDARLEGKYQLKEKDNNHLRNQVNQLLLKEDREEHQLKLGWILLPFLFYL